MNDRAAPAAVRVILGLPLYNAASHLPEAIESLLGQTFEDFALVLVDDCSVDDTAAVARRYGDRDGRIRYERNDVRLGLTRNWRRTFELAACLHPDARYFAWVSDHDVWHPRWLEALAEELERQPEAQMAAPDVAVIETGQVLRFLRPTRGTGDARGTGALARLIGGGVRAGNGIYGLFRVDAVRAAGGFRHVLAADRLLLAEVALRGPLARVPEVLWYRRLTTPFSLERQRRSCFPDGVPPYARLPWTLVHAAVLLWVLGVRAGGRPHFGRARGAWFAAGYVWITLSAIASKRMRRRRKRVRRSLRHSRKRALRLTRRVHRRLTRRSPAARLRLLRSRVGGS